HVADFSGGGFQHHVADETEGDAVGDGIREGHDQRRQRGRRGFGDFVPVDVDQFAHHQAGHVEQGGGGGVGGHGAGQGRDEQRGQEQQGHHQGRHAGAAAGLHARGAFHERGGAAGAQRGTR